MAGKISTPDRLRCLRPTFFATRKSNKTHIEVVPKPWVPPAMAPCAAHGPLEPPPPSSLILSLPLDVLPIHSVVASGSCSVPLSLCCRLLSTGAVISASSTSSASSSCHTYAFHCAPLVWLVVASPGASASPSHCISVRCIGLHPVPRLLPFILVWLVVALPGASTSPLVTTLLGAASHGTPLVWLVGCIAWCLG